MTTGDEGVYYSPADSPGLLSRLLIDLVDLIAVIVIAIVFEMAWEAVVPDGFGMAAALSLFALWWAYLVPLKRSRLGSLGFLLFRVKAVDLRGQRPTLWRMTLRLIVTLVFNTLIDLIYLTSDSGRQALRDKLSGVYVVRRSAAPAGWGRFVYGRCFFFMYTLIYREVARDGASTTAVPV